MTDVLDAYLADVDASTHATVRALDSAVRAGAPELVSAVKYRMLMYAAVPEPAPARGRPAPDWRHWVVAVDARPRVVGVRFLYGVLLDDPRGVLRRGSSVLMTWDLDPTAPVPVDELTAYVRQAAALQPWYRQHSAEVVEAVKAGRPVPRPD